MTNKQKAQAIYEYGMAHLTESEERYKGLLKLTGHMYRYEFDNILMVYEQKPRSTLVADYDTWKKVDRFVKRGSKGMLIFPSRALMYMKVGMVEAAGGRFITVDAGELTLGKKAMGGLV